MKKIATRKCKCLQRTIISCLFCASSPEMSLIVKKGQKQGTIITINDYKPASQSSAIKKLTVLA